MLRTLLAVVVLAIGLSPAAAQSGLTAEEQAALTEVETYLNGLQSMTADFTQRADDALYAGRFYWRRPDDDFRGGLRFDYENPVRHRLWTAGGRIYFYDAERDSLSHTDLEETPATLLLQRSLSFADQDQLAIHRVFVGDTQIRIELRRPFDEGGGGVELFFLRNPVELFRWVTIDPDGVRTTVDLSAVQENAPVSRDLFLYERDPGADDSGAFPGNN